MYTPKHFVDDSESNIRRLVEENGFVTILSFPDGDSPYINHLPVIWSTHTGERNVLIGHMSRRNPQWTHFQKNPKGLIIVNGPNTYISPKWYRSGRDVPTWNYAVAHLHGKIELLEQFELQTQILKQLTEFYERTSKTPWEFELPDDLLEPKALTSAIISFKFYIEKTEGKFKLSQNRSEDDRQGVIEGLEERTDTSSKSIQVLMKQREHKR